MVLAFILLWLSCGDFILFIGYILIYLITMGSKAYPRTAEKILISALRDLKMAVRYTFERLKSHSAKDSQEVFWYYHERNLPALCCAASAEARGEILSPAWKGNRCWQGRSCTRWITHFYTTYSWAVVQRDWPPCWLWTCSISLLTFIFLEEMPESWHW